MSSRAVGRERESPLSEAPSLATKSFFSPRAMRVQYRILFLEAGPCVDSDPVELGRKELSHEQQ
jgi:hypothetical protein